MGSIDSSTRTGEVRVDGATLRYVIEGSGIPTLVVGSSIYYPRTFQAALRSSLQLAFMDLRHFAEGDGVPNLTVDSYVGDIERVRQAIGFDRAVIVGHSHHGNVAFEYAKRYPAAVSHIVLIGSPPVGAGDTKAAASQYWTRHASRVRKAVLRDNWRALDPGALAAMPARDAYVAQYVADGPRYWYDARYDASWLWRDVPVNLPMIQAFRNFFRDYALTWNPAEMRRRILVVMGRYDYAVPPALWTEAHPLPRNVTLRIFDRSGHTPQLEEPALFNRVVLDWIRQDLGGSGR